MKQLKVRLTFTEPLLGTFPANESIYRDFIGSKAPDAATVDEEVAAIGADAVAEKGMTVYLGGNLSKGNARRRVDTRRHCTATPRIATATKCPAGQGIASS